MTETKYQVVIWYDAAATPGDIQDRMPSHTEKEEFQTLADAKEYISESLWQVNDLENNGAELPGGARKEYGYWSKTKDRQTRKQWYEWATVEIRELTVNKVNMSKVFTDE